MSDFCGGYADYGFNTKGNKVGVHYPGTILRHHWVSPGRTYYLEFFKISLISASKLSPLDNSGGVSGSSFFLL